MREYTAQMEESEALKRLVRQPRPPQFGHSLLALGLPYFPIISPNSIIRQMHSNNPAPYVPDIP